MRRNRPQTMKGRTVKFTLGMIGVLTVSAIVWRFYDPMPDVPMPTRKLPNPNGYDALVNIVRSLDWPGSDAIPIYKRPKEPANALVETERILARFESIFPKVEQALSLPFEPPFPASLPSVYGEDSSFSALHRLIGTRAETASRRRKYRESYHFAMMGWRLMQREALCGYYFWNRGTFGWRRRIYELYEHEAPIEARQYARFMETDLRLRPDFESILQREAENFRFVWLNRMKKPGWISDEPPREAPDWDYIQRSLIKRRTFMDIGMRDRLSKLRFIQQHRRWSDATYSVIDFGWQSKDVNLGPPIEENAWFAFELDRACDCLLMTYFALTAFRQAHGYYPQSLSELVPEILEQVPIDPFGNGKRFQYRKRGTSFILYSIGPDQVDNGGNPLLVDMGNGTKAGDIADSSDRGDLVWGSAKLTPTKAPGPKSSNQSLQQSRL